MSERDLPERLERYGGGHVVLDRVALLAADCSTLPSFAAKDRDPRFKWFAENYGTQCWELDALDPNALRARVQSSIEAEIDRDAWSLCERAQAAEQDALETLLDSWPGVGA